MHNQTVTNLFLATKSPMSTVLILQKNFDHKSTELRPAIPPNVLHAFTPIFLVCQLVKNLLVAWHNTISPSIPISHKSIQLLADLLNSLSSTKHSYLELRVNYERIYHKFMQKRNSLNLLDLPLMLTLKLLNCVKHTQIHQVLCPKERVQQEVGFLYIWTLYERIWHWGL